MQQCELCAFLNNTVPGDLPLTYYQIIYLSIYSRMKYQSFQEFRENEDGRRVAVEGALAELLARDTQYRKELKAHLETRLQTAEARRTMLISVIRKVLFFKLTAQQ